MVLIASQVADFGRNRHEIAPGLDQHNQHWQIYIRTYTGSNPAFILSAVALANSPKL